MVQTFTPQGSAPIPHIQVFEMDSTLSVSSDWTRIPGGSATRVEEMSDWGVDEEDRVHLSFVADSTTLIALVRGTSGWGEETVLSPPSQEVVVEKKMLVTASGHAALVWITGQSVLDLWGAHHDPSSGWGPPQRLELGSSPIDSFDAGIDDAGNVHFAYVTAEQLYSGQF